MISKALIKIGVTQIAIWVALGFVLVQGRIPIFSGLGICILLLFWALEYNTNAWHKQSYSELIEEINKDNKNNNDQNNNL